MFQFTVLLSFRGSLATKFMALNNEPCMTRPTVVDLNPVELKYYSFMISLDKSSGSCNSVDDLSTKICILIKTKDVNVKVFNMITNRKEAKIMVKHISCDCKCKCNIDKCQCECKNYYTCKKDYSWNPSTSICENGNYLKHF